MNRYGDTLEGMVESALEYARICERNEFFDIMFSMKASNLTRDDCCVSIVGDYFLWPRKLERFIPLYSPV